MEELKEKIIKKLISEENYEPDIDTILNHLKEELKEIAKNNGNDSTFGSIIRNISNE